MVYAIIRTGGRQYRVAEGDTVDIDLVDVDPGKTATFGEVLLYADGKHLTHGDPFISGAKVTAEVVGQGRGDKILVFHMKRKKQYKKMQGHRQNFTEVRIKAIEADGVTYTAEK